MSDLKMRAMLLAYEAKATRQQANRLLRRVSKLRARNADKENNRPPVDLTRHSLSFRAYDDHRRGTLRNESRAVHLARAFLRGHPYVKVEESRRADKERSFSSLVLPRLVSILHKETEFSRFDTVTLGRAVEKWIEGGA